MVERPALDRIPTGPRGPPAPQAGGDAKPAAASLAPRMHRRTFEDEGRERMTDVTSYDLRRAFARWMEAAEIPQTRRRLHTGHGVRDVIDECEAHEVSAVLAEDAGS